MKTGLGIWIFGNNSESSQLLVFVWGQYTWAFLSLCVVLRGYCSCHVREGICYGNDFRFTGQETHLQASEFTIFYPVLHLTVWSYQSYPSSRCTFSVSFSVHLLAPPTQ